MNKISKIFIILGVLIIFIFGQALFVIPDLCRTDGDLQVCVANGLRIITSLLVANALILLAIYFKK
ncbi:MAG: hypothetical protein AAB464_00255 [Patescibacteria group bacterium]